MATALRLLLVYLICVYSDSGSDDPCRTLASSTYENPGGVSRAAKYCIETFWNEVQSIGDGYALLDSAVQPPLRRLRLSPFGTWNASVQTPPDTTSVHPPDKIIYNFGQAEWVFPPRWDARESSAVVIMIHGGDASYDAMGRLYSGWSDSLVDMTSLPVFSVQFAQEPVVPWPANVRAVLEYMEYVLKNGPDGASAPERIFLVGDSEGTLVLVQTLLALMDDNFRLQLGFGQTLSNHSRWLAGVILSSPVVDVDCQTASMKWNCWNASANTGDPDTGTDCWDEWEDKVAECHWSYLIYHFGVSGNWIVNNVSEAERQFRGHADFFKQPVVNPFQSKLTPMPPVFLIAGTRDYFFSDSPRLAEKLCREGVDVEVFHAKGLFHDWLLYSHGCGENGTIGPFGVLPEATEAKSRIRRFVANRVSLPMRQAAFVV